MLEIKMRYKRSRIILIDLSTHLDTSEKRNQCIQRPVYKIFSNWNTNWKKNDKGKRATVSVILPDVLTYV